jgi:hypothetical protein
VKESENFVKIDPAFFFSTMFGSEMFESYIGELQVSEYSKWVLYRAQRKGLSQRWRGWWGGLVCSVHRGISGVAVDADRRTP